MIQENLNVERLQALQQLQRNLDPFQENPGGERIRAFGLNNLYLRMTDPSLEFVETVINGLINIPFTNLRQLQFDIYNVEQKPKQFFTKYGISVDDPEMLIAGIGNTERLLNYLVYKYDYGTGELKRGQELNPRVLAEIIHQEIQVNKRETQLRNDTEQVQNELNLRRRYGMGLALRREILDYIDSFPFAIYSMDNRNEPFEPTWENLTLYSRFLPQLERKDGDIIAASFGIEEAVNVAEAAITRYSLERKLRRLPSIDRERFNQLRFQNGAKAANLIILSELVGNINNLSNNYILRLAVPDFQVISVDSYRAWREGTLSDDDLHPYYEWVSGLKEDRRTSDKPATADFIVRSSAVFSEDGENITGAGIYESVRVNAGATFEEFKDAISRVYESTDSLHAQTYRAQHGIEQEEMGLLIQQYVYPRDGKGYLNSKLTGVPQLLEIVSERSRNFIKRKQLNLLLALNTIMYEDAFEKIHHFPPDQEKVNPHILNRVAQLAAVIERIWERDIQVEFVSSGSAINFVQVRELPTSTSEAAEVQFPDELPLHTGASIGIGDMELSVLGNHDDNSEKTGVVVFTNNHKFSWNSSLPQKGAAIILSSYGRNGHIQTLCAEKGLVCIFPDVNDDEGTIVQYEELSRLERVRIMSNGIEGRIYEI